MILVANKKLYADAGKYEEKLARVMDRLGVTDYTFDWGRWGADVQFSYKGGQYQFKHTVENAQAHGQKITWGSDCFSQIVQALEDLARLSGRGIYDLQVWVAGMKMLDAPAEVPSFFRYLRFEEIPASAEDVKARYRELAKEMHPDAGGDPDDFRKLTEASEKCVKWFGGGKP